MYPVSGFGVSKRQKDVEDVYTSHWPDRTPLETCMHRENGDYIILRLWLRPFVPLKDRGWLPLAGVDRGEWV